MFRCPSVRLSGIVFQACSFNHSDISSCVAGCDRQMTAAAQVSSKVVEPHEISVESLHLGCQCPSPVARGRHVRVDTRYAKAQPADAGDTPIAEAVNIDRIEFSLARDEHDPGVRDRPQEGPDVLDYRFLVSAGERYAH